MKHQIIYVNPCHGNAPFIMGTSIAIDIAKHIEDTTGESPNIIVPHMYGERQRRIMTEEGLLPSNVHLDSQLGGMYMEITFADAKWDENLQAILDKRDDVQKAVQRRIKDKYGECFVDINTGSHVSLGKDVPSFLAYPGAYSELYSATLAEPELMQHYNPDVVQRVRDMMLEFEQGIDILFIPSYHTFSFDRSREALARVSLQPVSIFRPM